MDSSSVADSRNLSFGTDSDTLLSEKILGRSERPWASVSSPGELTIHGSHADENVRIDVSGHEHCGNAQCTNEDVSRINHKLWEDMTNHPATHQRNLRAQTPEERKLYR